MPSERTVAYQELDVERAARICIRGKLDTDLVDIVQDWVDRRRRWLASIAEQPRPECFYEYAYF